MRDLAPTAAAGPTAEPGGTTSGGVASGRTDRWLALVAAVEQLAAAESLADVIKVVRETARSISGADGVTFVLRDGDLCHYVEENAVGPLWKGRKFPMTACISGWCMLHSEMAVIPDIYADPRIPHDAYRPTFVKSLVMTPVGVGKPLAAIGAYWAACREFDPAEVALLEGLGRSTAAAIAALHTRDTLRESEERLRLALGAGGMGAWEVNLATGEVNASALCRATLGVGEQDRLALAEVTRMIHPDDRARVRSMFEAALAASGEFEAELRIVRPDAAADQAERWVEVRGRVVRDVNGEPSRVTGVSLDVTDRHQAKERIERLQLELVHVGRLNEIGQMSSAFAHELNQPLGAAHNYLGAARCFLEGDTPSVAKAMDAVGKADAQFLRAGQIVQRIRGFIGKAETARAPEDVNALIAEAVEIAQVDPRWRAVEVRTALAPDLPAALVDKVQIQQVLLNLLRNAFEAMEGCDRKAATVRASLVEPGPFVEFAVEDSGPGLAPEVAARLFEPFLTTKAGGMGVGLSICRQIVESHGGAIRAERSPGGGTTFAFTVPAVRQG